MIEREQDIPTSDRMCQYIHTMSTNAIIDTLPNNRMPPESFHPTGEQLWQKPKDVRLELEKRATDAGIDLESILPQDVQASLEQYRQTIEHEMMNDFGIPEIPKQILAEMEYIVHSIEQSGGQEIFQGEPNEAVMQKLDLLAIKIAHFKDEPNAITIEDVPEEGFRYSYLTKKGEKKQGNENTSMPC